MFKLICFYRTRFLAADGVSSRIDVTLQLYYTRPGRISRDSAARNFADPGDREMNGKGPGVHATLFGSTQRDAATNIFTECCCTVCGD